MRQQKLQAHKADEGERLDQFLARAGDVSRGEVRRALERGGVWLGEKRIRIASRPVHAGESFLMVLEEAGRRGPVIERLEPARILHDDEWMIAVDKPPFVPAQQTLSADRGSLLYLVERHTGVPMGLVHRLDLMTSGITVFGKRREATRALAEAFREGRAGKCYWTLVSAPVPDRFVCEGSIGPDPTHKGRYRADPPEMGRGLPARTSFRVLARREGLTLVEAAPTTGRTHQIRAHLTSVGAPIVGDPLYGGTTSVTLDGVCHPIERVLLHARSLELPHPATHEPLRLEAPLPKDLAFFADVLGAL